jgi:hypothetical protein
MSKDYVQKLCPKTSKEWRDLTSTESVRSLRGFTRERLTNSPKSHDAQHDMLHITYKTLSMLHMHPVRTKHVILSRNPFRAHRTFKNIELHMLV